MSSLKGGDKIKVGSEVTMHFTIKLTDNTVAETTKKDKPAVFLLTEESVNDPVESKLLGRTAGEKFRVELTPEEGYGETLDSNIHTFDRQQFSEKVEPKLGDIFGFEKPNGDEVPGVILQVSSEKITVDFNHPLAGKNLLVEIEILATKPSELVPSAKTTEKVEQK